MRYWLIKSEPDAFSIDDLQRVKREPWTGVRNYQARNSMRDDMQPGDLAIFYHSNAVPPGAVGVARVAAGEAYPDPTQFDEKSDYYDPKSNPDAPRWMLRDFEFVAKFPTPFSLTEMKEDPALEGMVVTQKGTRLSITPVEAKHFKHVCKRGGWKLPAGK